ncbi:RasGEF domain-containing protein, partial [Reticulomyxa filosa]
KKKKKELLYHWIHYYPSDFSDALLANTLVTFIEQSKQTTVKIGTLSKRWYRLLQLIQRRKPRMKENLVLTSSVSNLRINPKVSISDSNVMQYRFTDSFFPPKEMVAHLHGSVDLLQIQPSILADQLTLIDTEIYLQIEIRGYCSQNVLFFFFLLLCTCVHICIRIYIYIYMQGVQVHSLVFMYITLWTELTNCAWQNCDHLDSNLFPSDDVNTLSPETSPYFGNARSPDTVLNTSISDMTMLALNTSMVGERNSTTTTTTTTLTPTTSTPTITTIENQLHESPLHKLETSKLDAPNLLYMIDHVNRLSLWVATVILKEKTLAKQVAMCKYFYSVAHRCLQLNNIHSCTSIFAGICLDPVDRLKRVKKLLFEDETVKTYHNGITCVMNTEKNYRFYRKLFEQWFESEQFCVSLLKT